MAKIAKKTAREKGILSDPNPKRRKTLEEDTVQRVKEFYLSEDVSRQMPGKKDTVSVLIGGKREHLQKHLILCNLREAFELFKERNPTIIIGFSKFAELRPKQCVMVGQSGTHSVCVCVIHQNMILLFAGSKLETLTADKENPLTSIQDCVGKLQCNPPSETCCLGQCTECGNDDELKTILEFYVE